MLKAQKGFTLIELVMVIVILGILAAVAIPRYIDLQADAEASANMAYIGAVRSAISMRFAQQLLSGGTPNVIGASVATKANIEALMATPPPPVTVLGGVAGVCGTGTWAGNGKLPGAAPVAITWTLTCDGGTGPMTLVPSTPGY